jgi:hypothetical protein
MSFGRPWIVAYLIAAFIPFFFLKEGQWIGFSIQAGKGVAGGTSPAVLPILLLVPFLLAKTPAASQRLEGRVGLFRRWLSFLLDLFISVSFLGSLVGSISVGIEVTRQRQLMWDFERTYLVPMDYLVGLLVLVLGSLLVLFYYLLPLTRGRQTVGDYVLGILVVKESGSSQFSLKEAAVRMWSAFKSGWPATWWRHDKQGRTWYDEETNCRVVRVKSPDFEL